MAMSKRHFKILQGICPSNVDNECTRVKGNCEYYNCPETEPKKKVTPTPANDNGGK